ncbi:putative Sin3 binding protein-domain-containing protein [Scheffersomyces xylosifermentans]|uniref:putative Sin3 binding protein-domain-containing protein n=1 Tax=Scheffersomyces xylosifermentans TaxID=1304137 RepID=UPI00315DDDEC
MPSTSPSISHHSPENSPSTGHKSAPSSKKLLSTSSPEGIQVASKITPTRLANLLIRKGPLPIRHITSHLAVEVPSFDLLSLSKQRRLIMAAMEQKDPTNNVVFEKIGWGQWAVRKVDSDFIVTEGTDASGNGDSDKKPSGLINVNDLRNQTNLKLGWSKKQQRPAQKPRRESITNNSKNLHNVELPVEPAQRSSTAIASDSEDDEDEGLSDNMEQDDEDSIESPDLSSSEEEEEEEESGVVFPFDQDDPSGNVSKISKFKTSPPIKFAKRVPIKISPPPTDISGLRSNSMSGANSNSLNSANTTNSRRKSSSSNPASSISKPQAYRHQLFNRSRLNSLDNLDNYILSSAKNSQASINSPPTIAAIQSPPQFGSSPVNSWNSSNYIDTISPEEFVINNANNLNAQSGRRKSSFNESHIRSTLSATMSQSLPKGSANLQPTVTVASVAQTLQMQQTPPQSHRPYDISNYAAKSTPSVLNHNGSNNYTNMTHSTSHGSHNGSDTDEEDWRSVGAENLRMQQSNGSRTRTNIDVSAAGDLNDEERSAAFALVDLMSV